MPPTSKRKKKILGKKKKKVVSKKKALRKKLAPASAPKKAPKPAPVPKPQRVTTFEDSLKYGVEGELLVVKWLVKNGHVVFPLAQFSTTHAPYADSPIGHLTFTDFVVSRGKGLWLGECKRSKWHEAGGKKHAGFSYKALERYKKLKQLTGTQLMVYFLQEASPGGLYCAELSELGAPRRTIHNGTPWALWPINKLKKLAPIGRGGWRI